MNNSAIRPPVVLNFDSAVGELPSETRIALADWQERIRFGCSLHTFAQLREWLDNCLPAEYGTVFLGSGDYHHLSWPLIERKAKKHPQFQVVLFDNHPDNMRFPFGIHCGSWVRKVALSPFVSHVHVLGITSPDISWRSAHENYWWPLLRGKLTYWCMDVDVSWAKYVGLRKSFRRFADPDSLVNSFLSELNSEPVYLTIDKDVLSPSVVQTNWDQGRLLEEHLHRVISGLSGRIIGSDITGDVSAFRYTTWWKKTLSALDGQTDVPAEQLLAWQTQQHALNLRLLQAITASSV